MKLHDTQKWVENLPVGITKHTAIAEKTTSC